MGKPSAHVAAVCQALSVHGRPNEYRRPPDDSEQHKGVADGAQYAHQRPARYACDPRHVARQKATADRVAESRRTGANQLRARVAGLVFLSRLNYKHCVPTGLHRLPFRVFMNRLLRCLTTGLMLAVCVISASAQSGASIAGSVVDQNKDAVAGALVKITNLTSGLVIIDRTGAVGEYLISGLPSGSYRVTIDRDGFATAVRTVTLGVVDHITQDFSLAPGTIKDTITVTAAKGNARASVETPQTVTVTTATEIEKDRPWSTFAAI